jgi:hypothetical protein
MRLEDATKEFNHSLPTLAVDALDMSVRVNAATGEIGGAVIRFYSIVYPQMAIELARIHANTDVLKAFVDIVGNAISYYPSKPNPNGEDPA